MNDLLEVHIPVLCSWHPNMVISFQQELRIAMFLYMANNLMQNQLSKYKDNLHYKSDLVH